MNRSQVFASIACLTGLVAAAPGWAETADGTFQLASRTFDVGEITGIIPRQLEDGFVSLTEVDWIREMLWSDPVMNATEIHLTDRRFRAIGEPGWLPDMTDRFHPDDTLPPLFDLEGYDVGWHGAANAPVRGQVMIYPAGHPERFFVLCAYDREDPKPTFCGLSFRYAPDPDIFVRVRIYAVTSPLNDFAEITARAEALARCLDVTEAVETDPVDATAPDLSIPDLLLGGRCRPEPIS